MSQNWTRVILFLNVFSILSASSFGGKGMELGVYANMIGQLLLRTLDRAQRIHLAMLYAALGLLLVETYSAYRAGHHA